MKTKFDLAALKAIPILDVASALGLTMVKTGGDAWQQRDSAVHGGVTSLTVFPKTNSFVRFSGITQGGRDKGSVIDFVMHVTDNPDFKTACEFLSRL